MCLVSTPSIARTMTPGLDGDPVIVWAEINTWENTHFCLEHTFLFFENSVCQERTLSIKSNYHGRSAIEPSHRCATNDFSVNCLSPGLTRPSWPISKHATVCDGEKGSVAVAWTKSHSKNVAQLRNYVARHSRRCQWVAFQFFWKLGSQVLPFIHFSLATADRSKTPSNRPAFSPKTLSKQCRAGEWKCTQSNNTHNHRPCVGNRPAFSS